MATNVEIVTQKPAEQGVSRDTYVPLRDEAISRREKQIAEKYPKENNLEWTIGIFDCFQDPRTCITGLFCPCVLHGKNTEMLRSVPWKLGCAVHSVYVGSSIVLAMSSLMACWAMNAAALLCPLNGLHVCWFYFASHASDNRNRLHRRYHLKNALCGNSCHDEFVHTCMHWCAVCQEHREIKNRVFVNSAKLNTVTTPPPLQEINADKERSSTTMEK